MTLDLGFLRTPSGCGHSALVTKGGALTRLPLATFFDHFVVRQASKTLFPPPLHLTSAIRSLPSRIQRSIILHRNFYHEGSR